MQSIETIRVKNGHFKILRINVLTYSLKKTHVNLKTKYEERKYYNDMKIRKMTGLRVIRTNNKNIKNTTFSKIVIMVFL